MEFIRVIGLVSGALSGVFLLFHTAAWGWYTGKSRVKHNIDVNWNTGGNCERNNLSDR